MIDSENLAKFSFNLIIINSFLSQRIRNVSGRSE